MTVRARSLALVLALAGCGPTLVRPAADTAVSAPTSDEARRLLGSSDPAVRVRGAALLALASDADVDAIVAALDDALRTRPTDVVCLALRAMVRAQNGALGAADEDALAALDAARTSTDPLAPFVAEMLADGLSVDVGDAAIRQARRARLTAMLEAPGRLGPHTVASLSYALSEDALRRGDTQTPRALAARIGCLPEVRVAGPFGPREAIAMDRVLPPDAPGPLADRYDLGPLRGEQDTRTVRSDRCGVWLGGGPVSGAGTSFVEARVVVPTARPVTLVVDSPNSFVLRVDGQERLRVDRRDALAPRKQRVRLELSAGEHELDVRLTSRHTNPILSVRVVGDDGLALDATGPALSGEPPSLPMGRDPLSAYVRARVLEARGDVVSAREALRGLVAGATASPLVLETKVSLDFGDPLRPGDASADAGRATLRALAERNPGAFLPVLELARLAAQESRLDEAIASLREAATRFPEVVSVGLTLVELLEQKGRQDEAETRLSAIASAHPHSCGVLDVQRQLAASMGRVLAVRAFAEQAVVCDARSHARLDQLLEAGDHDAALREVERLEALDLDGDPVHLQSTRLRIARARGDEATQQAIVARTAARFPRGTGPVLDEADRQLADGHRAEAAETLRRAAARDPSGIELRGVADALALSHTMAPYRLDGLEAIRSFREAGASYGDGAVYVLDYAAARVFPDGSYLYLVHQVVQVNGEEAIDRMGEFHPQGELLRARTIKADGTILEPDRIAGLPQLALPRLEDGDFVEYEYVLREGPAEGLEGGVLSHRFYFRSFDGPLHRTEYLVVHPTSLEVEFDRRGPLPDPVVTTEGDLRLVRFRMDQQEKPEEEPFSINAREFMPSVTWGVGARWSAFRDMLADQVEGTMPRDPELERLARRIAREASARSPRDVAKALYRWVLDHVEGDGSGLFDSAPGMLYDRTGNRDRVLQYMLKLVGIRADLVLLRTAGSDQADTSLPEDGIYDASALRVHLPGGPVFVTAASQGAPFGWLPSDWLGQRALVVASDGAEIRMPEQSGVRDDHVVELDAVLEEDGAARLEVVETFTGGQAASLRVDLQQVPEAELDMRFEAAYVARKFNGAALLRLRIEGLDDPEAPLVLRYAIEAPLAYADRDGLVVPPPLPFELGGALASVDRRQTVMLLPEARETIVLRMRLPDGVRLASPPSPVNLDGPGGASFRTRVAAEGRTVTVTRSFELRQARVAPGDYPLVARFAQAADRAEARPLELVAR